MTQGKDWWRGAVTYQIYPRSFQDSDGDGIGDLQGVIDRLEHVASLGVDAIWLSPFFTSPMKDMGYDVADYRGVDQLFGTMADFDSLLARAHELGLRVIIDQVLSHSSDQHTFFKQSRNSRENDKADWYVWADANPDGTPPNNWLSHFGGPAWTWDSRRKQFYLHNFLSSQPDFNFHNPAVQDWHVENLRFWLDKGVDGFRLDTVNYYFHDQLLRSNPALPPGMAEFDTIPYFFQDHIHQKTQPENLAFIERLRAMTDSYSGRVMVGEISAGHRARQVMGEYTRGTKRLHMAYSFDMLGANFSPEHFRETIEAFFAAAPDGWPAWAFSNHDTPRHISRWAEHGSPEALARLSAALLLSLEGSIYIYQGEELGQIETELYLHELRDPSGITFWPDYKGRDGSRTPMVWDNSSNGGFTSGTPWLPVKPPQLERHVAGQAGPDSILAFYRRMIGLRRTTPALRSGRTRFWDAGPDLLCFDRGGAVSCLFNLSERAVDLPLPALRSKLLLLAEGVSTTSSGYALAPLGFALFQTG
jgi:alpha-glucosidase